MLCLSYHAQNLTLPLFGYFPDPVKIGKYSGQPNPLQRPLWYGGMTAEDEGKEGGRVQSRLLTSRPDTSDAAGSQVLQKKRDAKSVYGLILVNVKSSVWSGLTDYNEEKDDNHQRYNHFHLGIEEKTKGKNYSLQYD